MSFKVSGSVINQVIFLLLSVKGSLQILGSSLLSDVSFVGLFLAVSFAEQFSILMKSSLSILSVVDYVICVEFRKSCQTQGHLVFFLHYLLEVL